MKTFLSSLTLASLAACGGGGDQTMSADATPLLSAEANAADSSTRSYGDPLISNNAATRSQADPFIVHNSATRSAGQ
jgi:hypothetical protein